VLETLSHTPPGEISFELDPAQPGRAVVWVQVGSTKYELARCRAHDAALLALAMHAPHDCNHAACPGAANLRRLDSRSDLRARAQAAIAGLAMTYEDLAAALGPVRAQALWDRIVALQSAVGTSPAATVVASRETPRT
jgi:hypothetical protein